MKNSFLLEDRYSTYVKNHLTHAYRQIVQDQPEHGISLRHQYHINRADDIVSTRKSKEPVTDDERQTVYSLHMIGDSRINQHFAPDRQINTHAITPGQNKNFVRFPHLMDCKRTLFQHQGVAHHV